MHIERRQVCSGHGLQQRALLFVAACRLPISLAAMLGAIQPLLVMALAWWLDAPLPNLSAVQWLAYALWFRGIARLPTVAVASQGLLSPLTAVVLGWALHGQCRITVSRMSEAGCSRRSVTREEPR